MARDVHFLLTGPFADLLAAGHMFGLERLRYPDMALLLKCLVRSSAPRVQDRAS